MTTSAVGPYEATDQPVLGIRGVLTAVDHKIIGLRWIVSAFIFFLMAGLLAAISKPSLRDSMR